MQGSLLKTVSTTSRGLRLGSSKAAKISELVTKLEEGTCPSYSTQQVIDFSLL